MSPPSPPIFTSLSFTTKLQASFNENPLYSIKQEISYATTERIKNSPWPVQETAHV